MTSRKILSIGAASCAIVAATPAMAQPEMTYEQRPYEYAQPAPVQAPQPAPITYRHDPVVQPIPVKAPMIKQPVVQQVEADEYDYEYEYEYDDQPVQHREVGYPQQYTAHPYHGQQVTYPQPHAGHAVQQQPAFDRVAWMEECEDRVGGNYGRRDRNGNIIGGLVGAAAGGLIGNRVAGRGDRLAGSLIGAGVGGLAGLAVGAVIDAATDGGSDRERDEARAYCEDWLARYSGGGYQQGYGAYGYQHTQQYVLVPVMVQVPQQAIVREYVTTETVDVEVVTYETEPRRRMIKQAPAPVKRVRAAPRQIKPQPIKRVRSVKGN